MGCQLLVFQSRNELKPATTARLQSGLNSAYSAFSCGKVAMRRPVDTFHIRALPDMLGMISHLPSRLNFGRHVACPVSNGGVKGFPVSAVHNLAVPSQSVVAITFPSGLKAA